MQRLKTFFHQKRFFQEEGQPPSLFSKTPEFEKEQDDWSGSIDHRLVENHRLRWWKRTDLILYLAATAIIIYAVYQWLAG